MTDPIEPRATRLQLLMAKSFKSDYVLDDDEMMLDMRAGMFMQLTDVQTPAAIRERLTDLLETCRENGLQPKDTIVPAAIAASLATAEKLMVSEKIPESRAAEIMLRVGAVYGLRPNMFEGASTLMIAELMERDLDVPALEKSLRRFGFAIDSGTVGKWSGTLPPAPKPAEPPRL
ncbi:MAG: hypothetical protein JNM12_02785 [Alphaproteobacteria bacterium]|nr:hypothetical protein [Alphaproteobacteria bacterium]